MYEGNRRASIDTPLRKVRTVEYSTGGRTCHTVYLRHNANTPVAEVEEVFVPDYST